MFKINWFNKLLIRFAPKAFFHLATKKQGINPKDINYAMTLFDNKKVDIFPLSGQGGRRFIIILDNKMSLYFYQNGSCFKFDGFEIGEYKKGDVTIFDSK